MLRGRTEAPREDAIRPQTRAPRDRAESRACVPASPQKGQASGRGWGGGRVLSGAGPQHSPRAKAEARGEDTRRGEIQRGEKATHVLNIFLEEQSPGSQRGRPNTGPRHPAPRSAQGQQTPKTERMSPEGLGLQGESEGLA